MRASTSIRMPFRNINTPISHYVSADSTFEDMGR